MYLLEVKKYEKDAADILIEYKGHVLAYEYDFGGTLCFVTMLESEAVDEGPIEDFFDEEECEMLWELIPEDLEKKS